MDTTIYSDGRGGRYAAIEMTWAMVREVLGHDHCGSPADDAALVVWLLSKGAPAWVETAEGWIDDACWGLIGPRVGDAS